MKSNLLIICFLFLISSCEKSQDEQTMHDLTSKDVLGYIDNTSEVIKLEALAAENNENAMHRLYLHYSVTKEMEKARKVCEKGARLGYERMILCLANSYYVIGGEENCNKVIHLFQQLKSVASDKRKIPKYMRRLGLLETNMGFECDKEMWNY